MRSYVRSLWQSLTEGPAGRLAKPYPLTLERLEHRFLLTGGYQQTNLVSDIPGLARHTDPDLLNPWGVVITPGGQVRVADNHSGLSTLYTQNGTILPKVFRIPPPHGSPPHTVAAPTGMVLNLTSDFDISSGHRSRPSTFIFDTEDGTLSGWNPQVDAIHAILTVDNSGSDAVYKGLAFGSNSHGNFLFAADFHNGKIDVFNKDFKQVKLSGSFTDPQLPPPPVGSPGFAPFGIQNIGGRLFVSYALQGSEQKDDQAGPGNGFIDVFDTSGNLLKRFASHGTLNSPWGMTVAPGDFGRFSHALLVGNFGDGRISAFNPATGALLGQLTDAKGQRITIDGLWGLTFSRGEDDEDAAGTLFFTAGLNDEADGLLGTLRPAGDHDRSSAGPNGGRTETAGATASFVRGTSRLTDGSTGTVASPTGITAGPAIWILTLPSGLKQGASTSAGAGTARDQALREFRPNLFDPGLTNGLAETLVNG